MLLSYKIKLPTKASSKTHSDRAIKQADARDFQFSNERARVENWDAKILLYQLLLFDFFVCWNISSTQREKVRKKQQ